MIYVMSDIHGNSKAYRSIMNQISLTNDDQLYILGDCIDRGPDGLDILYELHGMDNATILMGNHEYMMLQWLEGKLSEWFGNGGRVTYKTFKNISEKKKLEILSLIRNLPVEKDVEINGVRYKLCHSCPYGYRHIPAVTDPIQIAVWRRVDKYSHPAPGFHLIFGHTPTDHYQNDYPLKIWHGKNMTGIDCRAYAPAHGGRLACLRLDDMAEFYSKEISNARNNF